VSAITIIDKIVRHQHHGSTAHQKKGDSPFESPPKPTNTTFATLMRQLMIMTPKDLRDLMSELGININIKEEEGCNYPDANKNEDEPPGTTTN
jgi:hypothetical protein